MEIEQAIEAANQPYNVFPTRNEVFGRLKILMDAARKTRLTKTEIAKMVNISNSYLSWITTNGHENMREKEGLRGRSVSPDKIGKICAAYTLRLTEICNELKRAANGN